MFMQRLIAIYHPNFGRSLQQSKKRVVPPTMGFELEQPFNRKITFFTVFLNVDNQFSTTSLIGYLF